MHRVTILHNTQNTQQYAEQYTDRISDPEQKWPYFMKKMVNTYQHKEDFAMIFVSTVP